MAAEGNYSNRTVPLALVVAIAIFVFFGGVISGILFCGHYAHEPLAPMSGIALQKEDARPIGMLENDAGGILRAGEKERIGDEKPFSD